MSQQLTLHLDSIKKLEDGCYWYFYVHENSTLLDQSHLVCTKDDLRKLKNSLNQTDVIESCTSERMKQSGVFKSSETYLRLLLC